MEATKSELALQDANNLLQSEVTDLRNKLEDCEGQIAILKTELETTQVSLEEAIRAKEKAVSDSTASGEAVVKMVESEGALQAEMSALKESSSSDIAALQDKVNNLKAELITVQHQAEADVAQARAEAGENSNNSEVDVKAIMQDIFTATCERFDGSEGLSSEDIIKGMKKVLKKITASRS